MNLKTTFLLLALAAAGGALVWVTWSSTPAGADKEDGPKTILGVPAEQIQRVEVRRGSRVTVLERGADGSWTLPGGWAARAEEAGSLIELLARLHSRFKPAARQDSDPTPDKPTAAAILVQVGLKDGSKKLLFFEKADSDNRLERPTWLIVNNDEEKLRLTPGLLALLDRPTEYYQQRRLFPMERVAKEGSSKEKVEQLAATRGSSLILDKEGDKGNFPYRLNYDGSNWLVSLPETDRPLDQANKQAVTGLLTAVPDLWAEKFVQGSEVSGVLQAVVGSLMVPDGISGGAVAELPWLRLLSPEETLTLRLPNRSPITLHISSLTYPFQQRVVLPAPPPQQGLPPLPARTVTTTEEHRYAWLHNGSQLFTVKNDKLKDVFVSLDSIRDPRVARFPRQASFTSADVQQLQWSHNGQQIQVNRDKDRWLLEKPFHAEVEQGQINEFLDSLSRLETRGEDVSYTSDENKTGLARPTLIHVTLKSDENIRKALLGALTVPDGSGCEVVNTLVWQRLLCADQTTPLLSLEVGKQPPALLQSLTGAVGAAVGVFGGPGSLAWLKMLPTEQQAEKVYLRTAGQQRVNAVPAKTVALLDHSGLDLLDRTLLRIQPGLLERVQLKTGKETSTLEHKDNQWRVLDTPASPFVADADTVKEVEPTWQNLVAERFIDYGPMLDLGKYGLDKPEASITLKARKNALEMDTVEHTLELGKPQPDGSCYARLDKGPAVALLPARTVKDLTRPYSDYVNRNVLKFDASTVKQLLRDKGGDKLELVRREDGWFVTKPVEERAEEKAIQPLLSQLAELRARRVVAVAAKELQPFGLETPLATVTITLSEDQKPAQYLLKIGKPADDATGDYYALVEGNPAVVVLPGSLVRSLLASSLAFRDRGLLPKPFVTADAIHVTAGQRKLVFSQVAGSWKLTEPIKADAEQDDLDGLLSKLARLRAEELVAEKLTPEDLKKYGLDRPRVQWRIEADGKTVLDLQVGSQEKFGARCFARLAGRDLVFLLDSKLCSQLFAEYRSRVVWSPPLSEAQIDSVRFGFVKDPFTLKRTGLMWQVEGKPDSMLVTETVNDTLKTLADLKLERYVADKDADLQAYGLKAPELVLEATTKNGKRILQLGGREGETQRRYARVVEAGRTDVFLLSAADAAKLMRDLPALQRKEPTPPPFGSMP